MTEAFEQHLMSMPVDMLDEEDIAQIACIRARKARKARQARIEARPVFRTFHDPALWAAMGDNPLIGYGQ